MQTQAKSSTAVFFSAAVVAFARKASPFDRSDNFLQSQADIFTSKPVLTRAFEPVKDQMVKTFAKSTDPIEDMREGFYLTVEPARKSDTLVVSLESPSPQEAILFVNSLVGAYVAEQGHAKRNTGDSMVVDGGYTIY
jgi:uncharacterized protein involved in exopolysaccharide biosynthesis